jgi:hypothetical protein
VTSRHFSWRRIVRDSLVLLGIIAAGVYWWYLTSTGGQPVDVRAYWAADPANLYAPALGGQTTNAYLYTPAFEFIVGWWRSLPFEVFVAIWRAILLALLVWVAGPFTIFVLFTEPVAAEVNAGNIQIMLAAAIVIGFRYSASWAFVLLTKVTPGIGLIWFAMRRRWRDLGIALGVTAAIAAVSFVLHPELWRDYLAFLSGGLTGGASAGVAPYYLPFSVRLIPALAFIVWGGWKGYRWPVVVGSTLALPVYYIISTSMLVGVLPFAREALGKWLDGRFPGTAAPAPAQPATAAPDAA